MYLPHYSPSKYYYADLVVINSGLLDGFENIRMPVDELNNGSHLVDLLVHG